MVNSYTEKKRIQRDFGKRDPGTGNTWISCPFNWTPSNNSLMPTQKGHTGLRLHSAAYSPLPAILVLRSCNMSAIAWENRSLT